MNWLTLIRKTYQQHRWLARRRRLARQHAAGYARHPVEPDEFDGWEAIQAWGDEADGKITTDDSTAKT